MSCNETGNAKSLPIGIREEVTYRTPIHTTFDAGETVNPIFANSYESNLEANKEFSKSFNGQRGMSESDAIKGLNVRTLVISGDMKQNAYGFIKQAFQQGFSYDTDHMVYKDESTTFNCLNKTYTIWIPEVSNGVEYGERLDGCIPVSLEENYVDGTYTATFTPSKRTELTVANTIPTYPTDYNVSTYSFPNFNKTTGKLVYAGQALKTSELTYNITYTLDDGNASFYDENGDRNDFYIEGQETSLSYTSPLGKAATANNISRTLIDDQENNTARDFEFRIVEDATTKIVSTFKGIAQGETTAKGGSTLYNFSCTFKPVLVDGTSVTTKVYDEYGEITTF